MIVWSLFDSGNGSYSKACQDLSIENYSIGLDRENKNTHFINLDLTSTECINILSKLPDPDLIIASPPCESWSIASPMKKGNACWRRSDDDNFILRTNEEYEETRYNNIRCHRRRINGELCIISTIEIINYFKPKYYIIENPSSSKIWKYIHEILGFSLPYENKTYYNNYEYSVKKPTRFSSNLDLKLKCDNIKALYELQKVNGYNARSNIPHSLCIDIFNKVKYNLEENK